MKFPMDNFEWKIAVLMNVAFAGSGLLHNQNSVNIVTVSAKCLILLKVDGNLIDYEYDIYIKLKYVYMN